MNQCSWLGEDLLRDGSTEFDPTEFFESLYMAYKVPKKFPCRRSMIFPSTSERGVTSGQTRRRDRGNGTDFEGRDVETEEQTVHNRAIFNETAVLISINKARSGGTPLAVDLTRKHVTTDTLIKTDCHFSICNGRVCSSGAANLFNLLYSTAGRGIGSEMGEKNQARSVAASRSVGSRIECETFLSSRIHSAR